MWLLALVSLSLAWTARSVRITTVEWDLDGDAVSDEPGNGTRASLIAADGTSWSASDDATIDDAAGASTNSATTHDQSNTVGDASQTHGGLKSATVGANDSENGTPDNRSSAGMVQELPGGANLTASVVQLSTELATARGEQVAVPQAPDLQRAAAATLGIKGGQCGAQDMGIYIGCNLGCSCGWGSSCYRRLLSVSGGAVDVGVCEASMPVLVVASLLLLTSCVGMVLATRVALLSREEEPEPPLPPGAASSKEEDSGAASRDTLDSKGSSHVFEPALSTSGSDSGSNYDVNEPQDSVLLDADATPAGLPATAAAPRPSEPAQASTTLWSDCGSSPARSPSPGGTGLRLQTISETSFREGSMNLHRMSRGSVASERLEEPLQDSGGPSQSDPSERLDESGSCERAARRASGE